MRLTAENLYPKTRTVSLLAYRPAALSLFERRSINPFATEHETLEDVCSMTGEPFEELVREIRSLPVPDRQTEWERKPLYHLLDFLSAEHREFTHDFITAIQTGFNAGAGKRDFLGVLHPLVQGWPAFSAQLLEHITAEETFLFPKILRYEYCHTHGQAEPDFSEGSVKVFTAIHLLRNEQHQVSTIRNFLEASACSGCLDAMDPAAAGLYKLLEAFQKRLLEHSRMERELLFPRAEALEKALYDRFISGAPATPPSARLSPA
jgi:iron-sulfur cluster repair protein YtfE (RIC family)